MSAEILRRAAAELRSEWDGPNPMGTAWHRERDFHLAVAGWLDFEADKHDGDEWGGHERSLIVARSCLGIKPCEFDCLSCAVSGRCWDCPRCAGEPA